MPLVPFFGNRKTTIKDQTADLSDVLDGFSIEVMPRTAGKVDDFRGLLPKGTRIYIAHIEGTPIKDMVATAARLTAEGFHVMPHFPARVIADLTTLGDWIARYQGEADVKQALLLAGSRPSACGDFDSSMQLMETGLFDKHGFERLHIAGHPEGNRDIDANKSTRRVDQALMWKQSFADCTDAQLAIVTQFAFQAQPVIDWAARLADMGVTIPIHVGIAGPAKLQTLIKFGITCGVGASLKVLQKRAKDLSKLLVPFEPTEIVADFDTHTRDHPEGLIQNLHFFPLGGIKTNATWIGTHS